jgi:hypothetical protein
MVWTKLLSHATLATALAGGLLFFDAAPLAHAKDDDDVAACRRNVDKWEDRLQHDIDRHGVDSKQAQHDRHEMEEARDNCRKHFGDRWHDNDEHHDNDYDRH